MHTPTKRQVSAAPIVTFAGTVAVELVAVNRHRELKPIVLFIGDARDMCELGVTNRNGGKHRRAQRREIPAGGADLVHRLVDDVHLKKRGGVGFEVELPDHVPMAVGVDQVARDILA
jgi:hypothetical protein